MTKVVYYTSNNAKGGDFMPEVIEKGHGVSLNDHIVEYIKADKDFMEGIRKGVKACKEGRVRRWAEIKFV